MRTTLTIDDDVAVQLNRLRCERDSSLKDLVNEALRRGLRDMKGARNGARRCAPEPSTWASRWSISTTWRRPSRISRAKASG